MDVIAESEVQGGYILPTLIRHKQETDLYNIFS